jgi:hypothetical protein
MIVVKGPEVTAFIGICQRLGLMIQLSFITI